jgi:L-fuconolactonase
MAIFTGNFLHNDARTIWEHDGMIVVDSHCHVSPAWYEPVESLLDQMDRNGVSHAVLIQMNGQVHNDYLFDCLRRFPGRFAAVVVVDVGEAEAPRELERLAEQGASGVRLWPESRSPGDDPLAIWRAADRLGLAVSCYGTSAGFASDEFASVVAEFPKRPIVLEHLGSVSAPDADPAQQATRRKAFALSRFRNVYIKLPGLGEFCRRGRPSDDPFPFERPVPPLLEAAYAAFGAGRMMWGSDFPPVSAREGYRNALRFPSQALADTSDRERDLIFGEVALSVFPVR